MVDASDPTLMLRFAPLLLLAAGLAAPATAAPQPVLVDCQGRGVVKPESIQIGCATGSVLISGIRWTRWDLNTARGEGELVVNSCIYNGGPICVEGKTTSYPAQISLAGQASGPGITVFSEVRLTFKNQGPAALNRGVYKIDNPLGPR